MKSFLKLIKIQRYIHRVYTFVYTKKFEGGIMGLNSKEFTEKIDTGIKGNKNLTRFMLSFRFEGKLNRKIIDYSNKVWGTKDKKDNIKKEFAEFKDSVKSKHGGDFTPDTKFKDVASKYFENQTDTKWHKELKTAYDTYLVKDLGNKAIGRISGVTIDDLNNKLSDNLAPRTIYKIFGQVLIPILAYANKGNADIRIPAIPKYEKAEKKVVDGAPDKFKRLSLAIHKLYKDDPYHRSLFLLALYGRRWNEIATLRIDDIDFEKNEYTIQKENSKIGIKIPFPLVPVQVAALRELLPVKHSKNDLIFLKDPKHKKVWTPKAQLKNLKVEAQVPELTMHLFRHILASAVLQSGGNIESASQALGHTNTAITESTYVTKDHRIGSKRANEVLEVIIES